MKGKIFNEFEVQAIIAGNKTMFREVCKVQPKFSGQSLLFAESSTDKKHKGKYSWANVDEKLNITHRTDYFKPKFQVGQEIFVKEPFNIFYAQLVYKFSYEKVGRFFWMPASRMKQEQSRIMLKIKSVKVEKLQDISGKDCEKEGIGYTGGWNGEDYDDGEYYFGKLTESKDGMYYTNEMFEYEEDAFETYWNSTHKQEHKWEANPWVFVYEFEIINLKK